MAPLPLPRQPKWVYKPDLSAYSELKAPEQFSPWIKDTFFTMVALGLGNIVDATFTPDPVDQEAEEEFQQSGAPSTRPLHVTPLSVTKRSSTDKARMEQLKAGEVHWVAAP